MRAAPRTGADPSATVGFAVWTSRVPTGGNRYDAELAAGLARLGVDVQVHRVPGEWPDAGPSDRRALARLLTRHPVWLVDGIVAGAAPEVVRTARETGRRLVVLVHHFLPDDPELTGDRRRELARAEGAALRAAGEVVATSDWTAAQLGRRYGLTDATVAVPGVDPAPLATGGQGSTRQLLALGSLTPTKDQLTLVRALGRLRDLDWTARLVGPDQVVPSYTSRLHQEIVREGMPGRVLLGGACTGAALEAHWQTTDLLVLPSRVEPYGMVVSEALARGLPSVVTRGTGAVQAQAAGRDGTGGVARAGATVPVGRPDALAGVLRRWLCSPGLRAEWRAAARRQRRHLPGWTETATVVHDLLTRRPAPVPPAATHRGLG